MKRLLFLLISITLGGAALFGVYQIAKAPEDESAQKKLQMTASFYPLYFFSKEIAGQSADVYVLTPPGAEPHDFEPSTRDAARLRQSDILIMNGYVEPWADDVKKNLAGKGVKIIVATEGIALSDFVDEERHTAKDPHIWLDPILAKTIVQHIRNAMVDADPSSASIYAANADALLQKLDALDAAYRNGLSRCGQKNMVTAHAAFGYLTRRYGLTHIGIAGLDPDAEPSARELGKIVQLVKTNDILYIFFERMISPKFADTIANETGAKTLVLNPIEGLTPAEVAAGNNYFSVMEANLKNIRLALSCQ